MKSFKRHILVLITIIGLCSCEKTTYTLSSTVSPLLSGSVTPLTGTYEKGEVVTLVAQPNNGWVFQKWEGDISGTTNSASVTMSSNKNVVAVFLRREYPLTITITGEGTIQEKVISTPSKSYSFETIVELTPVPKAGWIFDGWEGDLLGIDYPKNITIDKDKSVKAKFIKAIQLFGGSNSDLALDAIHTKDGGFIIAGATSSDDGIFLGSSKYMSYDICIIKFDSNGEKKWVKKFGGSQGDFGFKIIQTQDGGYLILITSFSNDGDFIGLNNKGTDIRLIKLDSNGEKIWIKSYGGTKGDYGNSFVETIDGDYIIVGDSDSNDGDFTNLNIGYSDIFALKVNKNGEKVWLKTYGGTGNESGYDVIKSHDGGFVITGYANSTDGDFNEFAPVKGVILLIKVNSNGQIQWVSSNPNSVPSDDGVSGNQVIATRDGGYLTVGSKTSIEDEYFGGSRIVHLDLVVQKLNSLGNVIWNKTLAGLKNDEGFDVVQTVENDFLIIGTTSSNDQDFTGLNKGKTDAFALKLNLNGEKVWLKTFGGSKNEDARAVLQTLDGKYVISGNSSSIDGDFQGINMGFDDIFVIYLR